MYGSVKIFSTDPRRSNSGNMWAGMLANTFNAGNVVSAADLPNVLPQVQAYFRAMGHMEYSSGDIFESFINQGMGARPIIVGYENQLVEFVIEHQSSRDLIRDKIESFTRPLRRSASHPLISLAAMPAASRVAGQGFAGIGMEEHGFRSTPGVDNSPDVRQRHP